MAIKIQFDENNLVQTPTFILCKQSGERIGVIYPQDIDLKAKLNARSDISFIVYKEENKYFDDITDMRLIWVKEWNKLFTLSVDIDEADSLSKSIVAYSLAEAELSQIKVYDLEVNTETDAERENYAVTTFYDPHSEITSLLNRTLQNAPQFVLGHIDTSLYNLVRTFSFNGKTIYDILLDISKEFNCIFTFDCGLNADGEIVRTINAYDLESYCVDCGHRGIFTDVCPECGSTNVNNGYGEDTTIFISTVNLADEIKFITDTSAVKNCFKVAGGDDNVTAAISDININGSDRIYYIPDNIKMDMSEGLQERLAQYQVDIDSYKNDYAMSFGRDMVNDYNILVDRYSADYDLKRMPLNITGYKSLLENYYNNIDFLQYINEMPYTSESTTAAQEVRKIDVLQFDYNLTDKTTLTQLDKAALDLIKTYISPDYDLNVRISNLVNKNYYVTIRATNKNNASDYADKSLQIGIVDNYELKINQKIRQTIYGYAKDIGNVVSVFVGAYGAFTPVVDKLGLNKLDIYKDIAQSILDILIEEGISNMKSSYFTTYVMYRSKLNAVNLAIQQRTGELNKIQAVYDAIVAEKNDIQAALDFNTYFHDYINEFSTYRRDDDFTNSNYTSNGLSNADTFRKAAELIETAEKEIYKSATLQHSIQATLKNLLVMPEFAPIVDKFALGNFIRVQCNDNVYRLRLLEYEINFDNLENLPITFSDLTETADGATDIQDILNNAESMSSTYNFTQYQARMGNKSYKWFENWFNNGLDLTNKMIKNSDNQEVTMDNHGILCRSYNAFADEYEPTQLKIINSTIAITNDNWDSTKTAIGKFTYINPEDGETYSAYGINGETVIGSLILGEELGIYTDNARLKFNSDGLSVDNTINSVIINPNSNQLFTIKKNTENLFYVDDNGTLHIKGDGAGLDLTANESVTTLQGDLETEVSSLESQITQTAQEIKSTVSEATSKYDTGDYTVTLFGYGTPSDNGYAAGQYIGQYYLNQSNGVLYQAITTNGGPVWRTVKTCNLITSNLQSQITQNANNISLKVSSGDVVSEINQSSDTISLTAGRLLITTGNFRLNSSGNATLANATFTGGTIQSSNFAAGTGGMKINLSTGAIDTNSGDFSLTSAGRLTAKSANLTSATVSGTLSTTSGNFSMQMSGGVMTALYSGQHMMTSGIYSSSYATQYCWLGSYGTDGIALGMKTSSGDAETFIRINNSSAKTTEGCRLRFVGDVKFTGGQFKEHINFADNYGLKWGNNIGLRYYNEGGYYDQNNNSVNGLAVGFSNSTVMLLGTDIQCFSELKTHAGFSQYSDRRIKNNIEDLDDRAINFVNNLSAKTYKYNYLKNDKTRFGFIAQDVIEALKGAGYDVDEMAIISGSEDTSYSIGYMEFIPLLCNALKAQNQKIERMERDFESRLQALEKHLTK